MATRLRGALFILASAAALGSVGTFQFVAAGNRNRECARAIVFVASSESPPETTFEELARGGGLTLPPGASPLERGSDGPARVVLLGDIEVHAEEIVDPAHGMVIGHRVRFLRDRATCGEDRLTPPAHEHFEPPYRLLFDRTHEVLRVASDSSESPPVDFRRLPRKRPTGVVKVGRVVAAALLGLGAACWAVGSWRAVRPATRGGRATTHTAIAFLVCSVVLAAAALGAAWFGWDPAYLVQHAPIGPPGWSASDQERLTTFTLPPLCDGLPHRQARFS
jgi:hypothetical protein